MAVGPRDYIDQLLVKKYADEKVDNADITSLVEPEKMLDAMSDFSNMHKNMMILQNKLQNFCAAPNTKSVYYRGSRFATA